MAEITSQNTAVAPADQSTINAYADAWGVHPYYVTTLEVKNDPTLRLPAGKRTFAISGTLDETFSIRLGSQWDAPYNKSMRDMLGQSSSSMAQNIGNAMDVLKNLTGIETRSRAASAQVWVSSDSITFSLPFTFVAMKDAKTEVVERVSNLLKLVAPTQVAKGTMLKAPGPTLGSQIAGAVTGNTSGRQISLFVGTFMMLDNCIITSVETQFDSRLDKKGYPISAKVQVDIQSYYSCFTVQDIDSLFKYQPIMGN